MELSKLESHADLMLSALPQMMDLAWKHKKPQHRWAHVDNEEDAEAIAVAVRPAVTEEIRTNIYPFAVQVGPVFLKQPVEDGGYQERWACRLCVERTDELPKVPDAHAANKRKKKKAKATARSRAVTWTRTPPTKPKKSRAKGGAKRARKKPREK